MLTHLHPSFWPSPWSSPARRLHLARGTRGLPSSTRTAAANVLASSHIHRHWIKGAAPPSFAHEAPANSNAVAKEHNGLPQSSLRSSACPFANVQLDAPTHDRHRTRQSARRLVLRRRIPDRISPSPGTVRRVTPLEPRGHSALDRLHAATHRTRRLLPHVAPRIRNDRFVARPGVVMYHCFTSPR